MECLIIVLVSKLRLRQFTRSAQRLSHMLLSKIFRLPRTLALFSALFFAPSIFLFAAAFDVQGHRGARSVLPENSLPAFEYALRVGVSTLELDTGITKDGVVVVTHDQQINPTICQYKNGAKAKSGLLIHQLTLSEVKEFDCGSRANPRFKRQTLIPGTEIPTLREVFDMVAESSLPEAKRIHFNIETKSNPRKTGAQPSPEEFARLIIKLVDEYKLEERVILQSFDHRTLVAAHQQRPDLKLAALFHNNLTDWVTPTLAAKASIVSPKHTNLNASEVAAIHAANLQVIPWTANTEKSWKKLIEMNVDGIITDDPEPLVKMLEKR